MGTIARRNRKKEKQMTRKDYELQTNKYAQFRQQLSWSYHNAMLNNVHGIDQQTLMDTVHTYSMGQEL